MRELKKIYKIRTVLYLALLLLQFFENSLACIRVHTHPLAAVFAMVYSPFEKESLEKYCLTIAFDVRKKLHSAYKRYSLDQLQTLHLCEPIVRHFLLENVLKIGDVDLSEDFNKVTVDYQKIWKQNISVLKKKKAQIKSAISRYNIEDWLHKIKKFYGSTLSIESTACFDVFLLPVLNRNVATSFPIGNRLFLHQTHKGQAVTDDVGVIVHEICHSFFSTQSVAPKQVLRKFFEKHKSPYARLVKNYLNEALATAIGNRFIEKQITGKSIKDAYCEEYIDKYSEVLLPLIEEYLRQNKQMDENFLESAVKIFEKTFPNAIRNYDALFFDLVVFSNFQELDLVEIFRDVFWLTSFESLPVKTFGRTSRDIKQLFSIFILNNTQHIPGITLNNQPDSLYVNKEKNFIVIQTDCLKNIGKALQILKAQKYFTRSFLCKLKS